MPQQWETEGVRRAFGPLILAAAALAMLALTWRGWADPLVDFGRELYVAWRLAEGERLYRDIAWWSGPLSAHWNALWFRLFGPGLMVLAAVNGVVLAGVAAMLYGAAARLSGRLAATAVGTVFMLVFAFGQYVGIANYNWIAPYAHELTHGVALGLASLLALDRWRRTGSTGLAALAGLALGLAALTRIEPFAAAAAGSLVLLALGRRPRRAAPYIVWGIASLTPVVASVAIFGWTPTASAWTSAFDRQIRGMPLHVVGMGFDVPGLRFEEMVSWVIVGSIALAVPVSAGWLARETRSRWAGPIAGAATFVLLFAVREAIPWQDMLRPLPVIVLGGLVALGVRALRERGLDGEDRESFTGAPRPYGLACALGLFGLVLVMAGMPLNARVAHDGFALALPAFAWTVIASVGWLPAWLDRRGIRGDVVRGSVLAFLAVFSIAHVQVTASWMEGKTERVGAGRDAFRSDLRGAYVQMAVERLVESAVSTATVLPEGVMINYLSRTRNPTPFLTFMPPGLVRAGEDAWSEALREQTPEMVVIVPRDTSEFGFGPFGVGYGVTLLGGINMRFGADREFRLDGVNYEVRTLRRLGG